MASEQTTAAETTRVERGGSDSETAAPKSWAQRLWQRSTELGKGIVSLAGGLIAILTVVLVAAIVIESLVEKTVTVRPLSVPKALSDDGISPEIIALDLRDGLNMLVDDVKRGHGIETTEIMDPEELPDVAVPSVGLSAQALAADVRAFFKIQNRTVISGEVVSRGDSYVLTLRLNGKPFFHSPHGQPRDHLDDMVREGARATLKLTQPIFTAALAFDDGDGQQTVAICDTIIGKGKSQLDFQARNLKARALRSLGRVEEAIAETRTVIRLYPETFGPHNNLGLFLAKLDRRDEAVAEFRTAIALNPKYENAHTNLGNVLLSMGQTEEAMKELDAGISANPGAFWPRYARANAFRDRGRKDEALQDYRIAARLNLDHAEPHRDLGDAFHALGQGEEAAAEYRQALVLDPASAIAHRRLAAVLDDLGRRAEAAAERDAAEGAERTAAPRGTAAPTPRADGTDGPAVVQSAPPNP